MIAMALACQPQADHRRRADHRARRHGAGADPGPAEGADARDRRRADPDHARPGRGGALCRPCGGDVRRAHRRAGIGARAVRAAAPPLHARPAGLDPAARQRLPASAWCRSRASRPTWPRLPPGCAFAPRCQHAPTRPAVASRPLLRERRRPATCSACHHDHATSPDPMSPDPTTVAAGRRPEGALPAAAPGLLRKLDRRGEGGGRRLVHARAAARRWAWSARAAAARAPPAWRCCACSRSPAGASCSKAHDITAQQARTGTFRRRMQMVYQDPYGSLNPRMKVRDIVGEPLQVHGMDKNRGEYDERVAALLQHRGPAARHGRALPARVLRRPAPAHRHRPRAGAGAQPDHLRRAGVGAGRVDPGAGRQRAAWNCRSAWAWPICSSRTTWRWCATSATAWR